MLSLNKSYQKGKKSLDSTRNVWDVLALTVMWKHVQGSLTPLQFNPTQSTCQLFYYVAARKTSCSLKTAQRTMSSSWIIQLWAGKDVTVAASGSISASAQKKTGLEHQRLTLSLICFFIKHTQEVCNHLFPPLGWKKVVKLQKLLFDKILNFDLN